MNTRSCLAIVLAALAACSESTKPAPKPGVPAFVLLVTGDQQTDTVGRELPRVLLVRVLDTAGTRIPGQAVNFRVITGGGSVFAGAAVTNADGEAGERWTLGTVAGDTQRVQVRALDATGVPLAFGVFRAVGLPDAPTTVAKIGGDGQISVSGSVLPESLSVKVTDQYGNVTPGATVMWNASNGGGSVSPATSPSNLAGVARAAWTLGPAVGVQNATAGLSGHPPVTFSATTTAPSTPSSLTIVSGNTQRGVVGTVLFDSLVVRVTDRDGINVAGVTVTWTVSSGGGSISPVNTVTNSAGLAAAQWTLGSGGGTQTATASVSGIAGQTFQAQASNPLGPLVTISAHGGQGDESHTCALTSAGVAYCWGANTYGELGNSTFVGSPVPVTVSGGLTFAFLEAGGYYNCGRTAGGGIHCWGYDAYGQLGDSSQATRNSPVPFKFSALGLTSLSVGGQTSCGLTAGGSAFCWGWGYFGELGDGTTTESGLTPVQVLGSLTFSTIQVGGYHVCGLSSSGAAYCWGRNEFGELGNGSTTKSSTPVAVLGSLTFSSIAPGGLYYAEHTCALTAGGAAYCWGADSYGQLGDAGSVNATAPVAVKGGLTFSTITTGGFHTCGLTGTGVAYCWGRNDSGQLGDGSTTGSNVPVAVAGGLTFSGISAGAYHTCGLTASGTAYCWGRNTNGELGDGTTTNRPRPTHVVSQ